MTALGSKKTEFFVKGLEIYCVIYSPCAQQVTGHWLWEDSTWKMNWNSPSNTMRILERWFGTEEKPHRQMYVASIRMLHNWVNNTSDATHSKLLEQEVKTSESAPSNVLHTMHSKFAQVSRTTKHSAQLVPAKNWNLTNLNVSCYFPSTLSTLSYRLPALCSFYLKMFR